MCNVIYIISHGVKNISLGCGVRASLMLFLVYCAGTQKNLNPIIILLYRGVLGGIKIRHTFRRVDQLHPCA